MNSLSVPDIRTQTARPVAEDEGRSSRLLKWTRLDSVAGWLWTSPTKPHTAPICNRTASECDMTDWVCVSLPTSPVDLPISTAGRNNTSLAASSTGAVSRCIRRYDNLQREISQWKESLTRLSEGQFSADQLEESAAALAKLASEKNRQLTSWKERESQVVTLLHRQGADSISTVMNASVGSPVSIKTPVPGQPITNFTSKLQAILHCLASVHRNGFAHGHFGTDCLIESDGKMILTCLGMAREQTERAEPHHRAIDRVRYGTAVISNVPNPERLPPEAFVYSTGYEQAGDMWAAGVALAHWIAPNTCQAITDLFRSEVVNNMEKLEPSRKAVEKYGRDLYEACIATKTEATTLPHRRLINELLAGLLKPDPYKRLTVEKALNLHCFSPKLANE